MSDVAYVSLPESSINRSYDQHLVPIPTATLPIASASRSAMSSFAGLSSIAAPSYAIYVRSLSRSYNRTLILHHLNLTVPTGAIYGLLGPSGCGKVTSALHSTASARRDLSPSLTPVLALLLLLRC